MKKIKFAIVGFGFIGKRHAVMIDCNPNTELVAIVDNNLELKNEVAKEYSIPFFSSLDELFDAKVELDIVNICTPNGLHARQAIKALENKYHVVVEKPMGLHKAECEDVIYTALKYSRYVFIVKQNRYSPTSAWLKQITENNILGKIFMVQINCYWNRDERYYKPKSWKGTRDLDGGPLFTQFSHFIDIMYWVFGDIKNISTKFNNFTHQLSTQFADDSGFVSFDFVNGGMGSINYSTSIWDKNLESSILVIGEKGSLKIGGQYMEKVEYCHIKDYLMPTLPPTNPANDYGPYKGSAANHHYIFENIVDTLSGKSTLTTNAMEGMKVVEIIERIYNSR